MVEMGRSYPSPAGLSNRVGFISVLFILALTPAGVARNYGWAWLSFNYVPIVVSGMILLAGGWWLLSARKLFTESFSQATEDELAPIEARNGGTAAPSPATPAV
jgi:hypothetical protein